MIATGVQFVPLEVMAGDNKQRKMNCANTEGAFRIMQSIPSPKATFGMTPSEHKEFKNLKRENLRDHMTDLELIFSMLGEASTNEIARNRKVQGFDENKQAAHEGDCVAGKAREALEKRTKKKYQQKKIIWNWLQSPKKRN